MDRLEEVRNEISHHLEKLHRSIRPLFKSEPRLTLVIRQEKYPNAEIILTDDKDLGEVVRLLEQYGSAPDSAKEESEHE